MKQSEGLWVDKYSPKEFSQLLSPEKINRETLKALKEWDNFVFQGKKKISSDPLNASPGKCLQSSTEKDNDIEEDSDEDNDNP